ncbi:MAG: hypothetical protein WC087_01750 [Candidatus Paceibacterota bacterium]
MKILNNFLKVVLSLMLVMPIVGSLGIFPAPTADMYNTPEAFNFIQIMMDSGYITMMMSVVFLIALVSLWTGRVALAALLLLPITLNIVGFHAFLDGGLFKMGALMGNILLILNVYFLCQTKRQWMGLFRKG